MTDNAHFLCLESESTLSGNFIGLPQRLKMPVEELQMISFRKKQAGNFMNSSSNHCPLFLSCSSFSSHVGNEPSAIATSVYTIRPLFITLKYSDVGVISFTNRTLDCLNWRQLLANYFICSDRLECTIGRRVDYSQCFSWSLRNTWPRTSRNVFMRYYMYHF